MKNSISAQGINSNARFMAMTRPRPRSRSKSNPRREGPPATTKHGSPDHAPSGSISWRGRWGVCIRRAIARFSSITARWFLMTSWTLLSVVRSIIQLNSKRAGQGRRTWIPSASARSVITQSPRPSTCSGCRPRRNRFRALFRPSVRRPSRRSRHRNRLSGPRSCWGRSHSRR